MSANHKNDSVARIRIVGPRRLTSGAAVAVAARRLVASATQSQTAAYTAFVTVPPLPALHVVRLPEIVLGEGPLLPDVSRVGHFDAPLVRARAHGPNEVPVDHVVPRYLISQR